MSTLLSDGYLRERDVYGDETCDVTHGVVLGDGYV